MMILKEKAFAEAKDKFQAAGDAAEKELAFYLKRYFADDSEVFVLNDIRIAFNDDAAQMDHLIIHSAGMTIVETKSVAGKIQLRQDGQWLRWYGDKSSGMASPLIQAKLQADFLRKFLRANTRQPEIIDKLNLDYLVAISSQGVFIPPKENPPAEVCKTDMVGEKIQARANGEVVFPTAFRKVLGEFLCRSHTPRKAVTPEPAASAPIEPASVAREPQADYVVVPEATQRLVRSRPAHLGYIGERLRSTGLLRSLIGADEPRKVYATYCRKCDSQNLEFRYGKFGYFLRCLDCSENTSLKPDCRQCGRQTKLRKDGQLLFVECASCKLSEVLHRNDRPIPELKG
ncbi:nuclease-related domain-containing protein [Crenobacter cavernae]|uniref:NERD domain-containing protein n=1 Tax=Crenobacter cavernae TaxID=2290923 RepID=A0A345Y8Z8_9NEIS|nr:nuclease-related domain-containing protein [Crenobacter cavernae]AXK40400.1 hypothetical protein DWG20_13710 [Crenobacter cavernae]